jgi:hypothetical protein
MKRKQVPVNQLDLFESTPVDYDQLVTDKANGLLDLLNMDLKQKDKYKILWYIQEQKYIVLIAANRFKDLVCNIVDIYGNVPKDFSVNWRNFFHIEQELKTKLNITIPKN